MPNLAIAGGTPVRSRPFVGWPQFDDHERQSVLKVLESGNWGGYPFPNVLAKEFGLRFAEFHDAKFGVPVANGTVGIEIALRAAGIGPGDEVIVPAYTFEATAIPVLRLGGIPVFVDVLPETYCIDPAAAEGAVTERTKAVVPVHLAMNMANMDALSRLAETRGVSVVEDCAHAHGAKWRDRGAGSFGTAGAFSMQSSKLMTCGEGGAVITSDEETWELCQSYINCGRASAEDRYGHRITGYNYRISEVQAAILLAQLERLSEQQGKRDAMASQLEQGLSSISGITFLKRDERQTARAIYQYVFRYDSNWFGGADRDRFVAALEAEGVPCDGLFYEPVYRSALFRIDPDDHPQLSGRLPWEGQLCPVAERAAYRESVWLPHQVLLGEPSDLDDVVEGVLKIQANLDELLKAEHPLIDLKRMNRAERPRFE